MLIWGLIFRVGEIIWRGVVFLCPRKLIFRKVWGFEKVGLIIWGSEKIA